VLVASTRSTRLSLSNSARVIVTVSVVDPAGLIVSVALRVTPLSVALIVALAVAVTDTVVIVKLAEEAPAGTVIVAGTEARVLLLARLTVVAADTVELNVTVPVALFSPVTVLGLNVKPATVTVVGGGGGGGAEGVTVTRTDRLPS
jgi:hypothetical protein